MRLFFTVLFISSLVPIIASSQPLHIGVGPGFALMHPPEAYAGYTTDVTGGLSSKEVTVVDGQRLDMAYSGIARVRLQLPSLPLSVCGGLAYARVVGATEHVLGTMPSWSSLAYQAGRLETKTSIFSLSAGMRWDLLKTPVIPFLAGMVSYNRFGEMTITVISDQLTTTATTDGMSRTGIAFSGGVSFPLQRLLRAEVEAGYAMPNALGRETGEKVRDAVTVSLLFSYEVM